ncbi:MAG: RHS repeat-associated core domain-containing protein, partial [bacterium]
QWYRGSDAYQQTHLDNRLGFAGYVWDPWLKVYHVRHRVYDPFDTRWLQADPIGYAGGDTDLRRYCNGDPINYIDPLGLWGTQDPAPPDGGGAWNSGPMIPSWIHTTLDVVGFVPGVGTAADIANGGLYAIDGEWDEAGLSLVGAIPVIGDAIAGTRKGIKAANKIDDAVDAAKGAEAAKGVNNAEDAASKAGNPKKPDDAGKKTDGEGCGKPDDGPKKSNQEKGKIGESEADKYYESQGYEKLNSKVGSDNGFDGVYVKRDKDGNITEMVLNESKYSDSGRFKLSTSEAGKQMSDPWIKNTLDRMERSTDPSVSNTGAAIREAMQRGVVRTRGTLSTPSGPMTPGTIMPGGRFIADPSQ